ncbi:hypothetical protein Pse7367_1906 [Thalassoporum mexicanum PCC 7367]|nr:hypothetical protein Pse7367_1906 [Pseudanabaena sp. PCC 7367]
MKFANCISALLQVEKKLAYIASMINLAVKENAV